ncbi:9510_t:CDS:1 [Funneliformis geosporum]|uniref:15754_t:CDS:1 n=1 Tax=Funneliformis geosporum TaxID=1117311 RepID=A0A9W4WWI1_9GLOM|nr:9510_t:CDS:1 [Funneliformis geosporum]CAI2177415.1 15754_t:CDS:1 [Funneliformis geosporum]
MSLPMLNEDVIIQIIKHLQDDKLNLHNCLFICRQWCRLTIPLLWKQPFSMISFNKKKRLLRTYITCLNEEEAKILMAHDLKIDITEKPLFQYAEYLQEFNDLQLQLMIKSWLPKKEPELLHLIFFKQMCLMFMRHSKHLRTFNINLNSDLPDSRIFTKVHPGITNLKSLQFKLDHFHPSKYPNFIDLLERLPNLCFKIEELNFSFGKVMNSKDQNFDTTLLVNIIKTQRNLKVFTINKGGNYFGRIIPYLELYQANFLNTITFSFIDFTGFSLEGLMRCHKLKSLTMNFCNELTINHCKEFSNSTFQIEGLKLLDNKWAPNITITLIQIIGENSGESLKDLIIDDFTISTIQILTDNFHNLNYLYMRNINLPVIHSHLFYWASKKHELKRLEIRTLKSSSLNDQLLEMFGENLPPSLTHLTLNFKFTLKGLENFFKSCKAPLKILRIEETHMKDIEYTSLIQQYSRRYQNLKIYPIDRK